MEKEQTSPVSARIPLFIVAEIHEELRESGQNMNEFINDAIKEKLYNENPEKLDIEIKHLKKTLNFLQKKAKNRVKKAKNMQKIPQNELLFLVETQKILEKDPNFIHGRINLYKNKFGKQYKISDQEFFELTEKAKNQYQKKEILEEK